MKSKNIGQKCVRTVSSHVFAGTFAELNNNMILNENFPHGKNSVRLILAKFRLSFNDSQKQRFFNCNMSQLQDRRSHPTRVRGLKHPWYEKQKLSLESHPTRVRGLKPLKVKLLIGFFVAPHTGAWIETIHSKNSARLACRTPHGCVD